ncbi:2',5'-phosphodiesterase 12 [Drosophila elegans]|uniref:2',5'-phosphodiesterase 12 n=1 Tax=Drosophila elegans TaxID=30023 RepID=UPI0007E86DEA|nr:2',5'-phosphodiesterase 12 [Drosophila elegans]XP_017115628.1 2',5'-phosphodiesterase 12 [Drosophila elegans]
MGFTKSAKSLAVCYLRNKILGTDIFARSSTQSGILFSTRFRGSSCSINMEKVYFRNASDSKDLDIVFRFVNTNLNINREFNFRRQMNEPINAILARIQSNIQSRLAKSSKKSKNKPPAEINVKLYSDSCDDNFSEMTFDELFAKDPTGLKLQVVDTVYDMVFNPPWIASLKLPSCILAGFVVYPTNVQIQFGERQHSKGLWYKAKRPTDTEWTLCGEGFQYLVTPEDVGYHLKFELTPRNEQGANGPVVEKISNSAVQAAPGLCPFQARHHHTPNYLSDSNEIRVVTYNLLADLYASSDYAGKTLFSYCPAKYLQIDFRKPLFINEIIGYNSDLICLQEVDQRIFDFDLKEILEQPPYNYHGIMAPKGKCAEGVAIFFRTSRFELLDSQVLHLGSKISVLPVFESLWNKIKTNTQLAERICDRSTTLQTCLLKIRGTENYVLVANTHLYFHPDADHIRLLQMGFSMLFIEHLINKAVKDFNISSRQNIGLIFCGDFNSVPECGIYKLMTEKLAEESLEDWRSNAEEAVSNVQLSQPFQMTSACGAPEYTHYTTLFSGCLDYIFYQNDRFELIQYVPLPTEEQLKANAGIPSAVFPSDHVALVADLRFKAN